MKHRFELKLKKLEEVIFMLKQMNKIQELIAKDASREIINTEYNLLNSTMRKLGNDLEESSGISLNPNDCFRNKIEQISTGIEGFDDVLQGGLRKKEITMLIAKTGVGRTTFATILSNSIALQGSKVLQIFFEDNEQEIKEKHISRLIGMSSKEAYLNVEEAAKRLNGWNETHREEAKMLSENLHILRLIPGSTTIDRIKEAIEERKDEGWMPSVVVIDYLSCLTPIGGMMDKYQSEASIIRALEAISQEYNLVMFLTEQTNRNGYDENSPIGSIIQGSISKIQTSASVFFLTRSEDQEKANKADFIIEKCRYARRHTLKDITFNNELLQLDFSTATEYEELPFSKEENADKKHNEMNLAFIAFCNKLLRTNRPSSIEELRMICLEEYKKGNCKGTGKGKSETSFDGYWTRNEEQINAFFN